MNINEELDNARREVFQQIEKREKNFKLLVSFIALLEGVLLLALIWNMNWTDKTHIIIFVSTLLIYLVLGLGLFALGIYQNINTLKVLKAITLSSK